MSYIEVHLPDGRVEQFQLTRNPMIRTPRCRCQRSMIVHFRSESLVCFFDLTRAMSKRDALYLLAYHGKHVFFSLLHTCGCQL